MGRSMELSPWLTPWTTATTWLNTFMSSACNLAPDHTTTLSLSHPTENGVITTGTRDCRLRGRLTITFLQQRGGFGRSRQGHRRYYAAVIRDGRPRPQAPRRRRITLAAGPSGYTVDETHALALRVEGPTLTMFVDGRRLPARPTTSMYRAGRASW